MPIISSQITMIKNISDKDKILSEVKTFFDEMRECNMPIKGLAIKDQTDVIRKINICSSIEDIIRHIVCKIDFKKGFIMDGSACNNNASVSNDNLSVQFPSHPCTANLLNSAPVASEMNACIFNESQNNTDMPFDDNAFIENVKYIEEKIASQLFTPIKIGRKEPKFQTFIQLDSGASTNLMGMDMARHLNDNYLVNFVYPSSKTILTDVQHNEIAQPLKPINVTILFGNEAIEMPFHILKDLEYPLLGLKTMIDNKMSIINEHENSYLAIGNVTSPKSIIRTVRSIENELNILGDTKLHPGINLVRCTTQVPSGQLVITDNGEWLDTCITICNQSTTVTDNKLDLLIMNQSENYLELYHNFPLISTSLQLKNNVASCFKIEEHTPEIQPLEPDEGRFKFPLSEEEGLKLLESVEPLSFPLFYEGETEDIIDWKAELKKPGMFLSEWYDSFCDFVENEIPNIFARTEYDCGKLDRKYGYIDDIPMTTDRPIASPQINVGPIRSAQIRSTFDRLEANGIVVKGHSPYATPCFVVPKITSNRTRVVMDYRELNNNCLALKQPVKNIGNLTQFIANIHPKVYSLVDVCNAFYTLELGEKASLKCSILTPHCQYNPKRLLFGYKNAPAIFLQAMECVFAELPRIPGEPPFCEFYFDDIIIFSRNEEDHFRHLKTVLTLLHKVGLKIQAAKNQFFKPKVELLGKVISGNTISPQKRHIDSLQKFPRPTTIKQLQSFLGICTWNCNLVPDYSQTIQPLTRLLRKNEPFVWGEDQENTFQYLKQYFTERTVLYFIDYSQPIYIAADASDKFLSGIAYQIKSYSESEIPALKESLLHTKELHKLPVPLHPTNHPLLPKGAIGIPSPFKLDAEGINSPHDANKIMRDAQIGQSTDNIETIDTNDYLDSSNKLHIICNVGFFSSSLSKSQEGYSIIEKEAFAVVSSLEFFKPLLQGIEEVYILSDSRPFLFIMKMMKCSISRIQRWSLKLFSMPFTIIMVHIKGTVNYSDSLTRVWAVEDDPTELADLKKAVIVTSPFKLGQLVTYNDLVEALEKNPNLVSYTIKEPKIKSFIQNINKVSSAVKYVGSCIVTEAVKMTTPSEISLAQQKDSFCYNLTLKSHAKFYSFKNTWYKRRDNQVELNDEGRIIVPRKLIAPTIALFHFENHSGINNLHDQMKAVYYFPNMRASITEFVRMCHLCAVYKSTTSPKIPIASRELDPVPKNTVWSFDVIDGFPKHRNSGSILSMVEYYSGYRVITPLKNTLSTEIARIIEKEIIATFGPPRLMITDGGSNLLRSKNLKKLTHFYGIQSYVTSPYHPASHGRIEVSHRAITMLIKIAGEHLQRPWFDICAFVQIALNSRPSSTLGGHSPMYFMFGIDPTYRLRENIKLKDIPDLKEQQVIWKAHDEANKIILKNYNKLRNKLNQKVGGKMVDYKVGDFIWARNYTKSPKQKIQTRYLTEPLEVVKDFGYALLAKNHLGIVFKLHKNNVKRYFPRNLELYNALPFKLKLKLGSTFDQKDLHKYYDDINKEENDPDIIETPRSGDPENDSGPKITNSYDSDNDSEDEELNKILDIIQMSPNEPTSHETETITDQTKSLEPVINDQSKPSKNIEIKDSISENIKPIINENSVKPSSNVREPSLPFHMKLRNDFKTIRNKVRFFKKE